MRMVQARIQNFSKEGGGGGEVHVGCENCTFWAYFATMEVHVRLQDFFRGGIGTGRLETLLSMIRGSIRGGRSLRKLLIFLGF